MSGQALDSEVYTSTNGKAVFVVYAENGDRYEYNGPDHPNSTTTLYGNWTGIAPYANALPVKVRGRYHWQTSALDSFSMLYYIQSYTMGYHNVQQDTEYIQRIQSALDARTISATRDLDEFKTALRILRSFETSGHIFQTIAMTASTDEYDVSVGALPRSTLQQIFQDASSTYPLFDFSDEEVAQYKEFVQLNPSIPPPTDVKTLVEYLTEAGLGSSVECLWLKKRLFETNQAEEATKHMVAQLSSHHKGPSYLFPSFTTSQQRRTVTPKTSVQEDVMIQAVTSKIISSLL